mmetsp:Transcript_15567/g.29365  ORF Transcript_15567/g.29365 Transcript_15567/m.29365 type:complete len:121 (-) Transcript_15567:406-768(-)
MIMTSRFVFISCLLLFTAGLSKIHAFIAPTTTFAQQARTISTDLKMTVLTYNGKKKDFKPGSPLKDACASLGVKPKYSCKKGDCGSCTITVAGSRVKACVGKVPPEPRLKSLQEKGLEIK